MFSLVPRRIIAFLLTALIIAPILFLTPSPFGGSVAHAIPIGNQILNAIGSGVFTITEKVVGFLIKPLVYLFFVKIPQFFFFFSGVAFDTLIAFSLSSSVIKNAAFVNTGWVIVRDISNTFFIFILLYIAISTILQTAGGQTKRLLATLVVVALLMNFSLYITKFVIDVGNIFALEFYTNITGPGVPFITLPDITPKSISAGFMSVFSLEKFNVSLNLDNLFNGDLTRTIFVYILLGIIYLVAAFVFLSAALLFLARVVAFWFLMLLSPLAFFSMILPFTSRFWSRWFSELISQTFLAPVFLFFVYLTLILAKTVGTLFSVNPQATDDPLVQLLLAFLTAFALITTLLFGLKTAKSMSGTLGESMLKIGGVAMGAAVGAGAWAGRNTGGRLARYADDKFGSDLEKSRAGRFVKSQLNTVATSSFDARGSKIFQTAQSTVGGVNLGEAGGKGGQAGAVAEKQKDLAEHTKKLLAKDPEAAASYLATHEFGGDRDTTAAMASLSSAQRAELIAKAKPGKEQDRLKRINMALGAGLTEKQQKLEQKGIKEYEKTARKEDREAAQGERVAKLATIRNEFEATRDDTEKAMAKEKAKALLEEMKGEEIAELEGGLLASDVVAHHLSDKDLEQIERKANLTKGHQEALYANIKAHGRDDAKAYLNLSPNIQRRKAAKNRKWEAGEIEEKLKEALKESETAKKEGGEPGSENKA